MKKIDSDNIAIVNFIASPILYLVALLPLMKYFNLSMRLAPIVIVVHNLLFWSLCIYYEKRIE